MTTIVYKDGVVAYDSRCCAGDLIVDDHYDKKIVRNGVYFFMAGSLSDDDNFIDVWFGKEEPTEDNSNAAIVVDEHGEPWLAAVNETDGFWKRRLYDGHVYAIGSGSYFAFTALDLGQDAAGAVKTAMLRDCRTGGKVHVYRIKKTKRKVEEQDG
jgi:20S proteasome alpha/beta subunit